jgi:hypothetical protein
VCGTTVLPHLTVFIHSLIGLLRGTLAHLSSF